MIWKTVLDSLRNACGDSGGCPFLGLIVTYCNSGCKNSPINIVRLQKSELTCKSKQTQIIQWEAVKNVIKPLIRLFFISHTIWVFIFIFCFVEGISMTSGQGIHMGGQSCCFPVDSLAVRGWKLKWENWPARKY